MICLEAARFTHCQAMSLVLFCTTFLTSLSAADPPVEATTCFIILLGPQAVATSESDGCSDHAQIQQAHLAACQSSDPRDKHFVLCFYN